jgi:formylglycine-generating enzyme required for sulfatase activity
MALVGRTCVDRYEAHLVVEVVGVPHPHWQRPEPGVRYQARSAAGVFPQGYVSREEAKEACEASEKRLCSRREWLRACQEKGIQTYPYGERGVRGRCNTGKNHLLVEVFGHNPRGGFKYDDHFNSPKLNQMPGFLARTGEHPGCSSELNVFDMVGNLHEWVSDKVDTAFMEKLDTEDVDRREQPWSVGNGVFMGGFYSTTSELGPGCFYTTVAHEPRYHDYSTGFRCCSNAVLPATLPASTKKGKGR